MSYLNIANKLQSELCKIAGIGRVYTEKKWTNNSNDFYNLFSYNLPDNLKRTQKQTADIRGCMITRNGFNDEQTANTTNTVKHRFKFILIRSLISEQSTELDFQNIIDLIAANFRPQGNLGSLVELTQPIQAETIDERVVSGILCHYAELTLEVQEYFTS